MTTQEKKILFAVKGLVFHDNKFLIIHKRPELTEMKPYWELPGGRANFGETPKETLLREMNEEIGIENIQPVKIVSSWSLMVNDHCQIIGIIYACKANGNIVKLSEEHDEFIWINPEEYKKYNLHTSFVKEMDLWNWEKIMEDL